jgi:hypothetical protein
MPVRRKKSLPPRKKARKKSLPPRKIARKKYRSDSSSDSSSDRDDGSAALLARIERRMSASPIKHAPSKRRASSVKKSVKKRKVRKSVASDSSTDSDSSINWMVILFILLQVILRRWTLSYLYKINELCGCKGNLNDVQLKSRSKFVADSCSDTCTRASRIESELMVSFVFLIYLVFKIKNQQEINQKYLQIYLWIVCILGI